MGWLEDKERILALEAEIVRLRNELTVALVTCDEELAKAPLLGYDLNGPYVERWRDLKERFQTALQRQVL
jgi:hypothetical protein